MRKLTGLVASVLVFGLVAAPVQAKKTAGPATYYISWAGDCAGAPFLGTAPAPNPDACALFFPGLGNTYSFPTIEGVPFVLDARKPIEVDFEIGQVASAAAKFDVALTGEVGGKNVDLGAGSVTVTAGVPIEDVVVSLDLQPDASLHKAKVTRMTLTVTWSEGVTYSQMVLEEGTATVVVNRLK